ncbi:MAG: alpha/beta hydrolase [Thermodesulfobacteriota bacterium]|jgi:pimeloyl-ACP methyl ester carboxylesterase
MPFVNIKRIKVYYEVHGDGDVIVLLHHGFGSTKIWKGIYPSLVEKGYRVITYDRRGYGQSEKGTDFEEFYVSDRFCMESVEELALLRCILNFDSFHIIGQCEGGVIGIEYAVKYPDQVKTVVISSTQCFSKIPMVEFNKSAFPKIFQELELEAKEKLAYLQGKEHVESFYNQFRQFGGAYGKGLFDIRNLLASVKCPALVLYPDRSILFDVKQGVEFYQNLPQGELAILPRCGHNTYEEQPEEYIRFVLNFLRRHHS